jgi:hypothetical protein
MTPSFPCELCKIASFLFKISWLFSPGIALFWFLFVFRQANLNVCSGDVCAERGRRLVHQAVVLDAKVLA